ncbi:MAG: metallophosphoesterase [Acetobacteraceae bacterium]|nr:metallophosphoesterase [Acetobacteraceae bacterium]
MTLAFIGDIHQQWHCVEAGLAALDTPLEAAVLLGDMQCDRALDELAAPLLSRGVAVFWIFGNHDNDGGPAMWANLTDPARNRLTAPGALHGRVAEIGGLRIAGLGGTFRPRVWEPPEPPRLRARAELPADLAAMAGHWPEAHRAALAHSLGAAAVWPEDVARLSTMRADVLVAHEAPSSHPVGKAVIDELARRMGARLVVHGHHHVNYRARAPDGLEVLGVAPAWGVLQDGRVLWPGERPRPLGRLAPGWRLMRALD